VSPQDRGAADRIPRNPTFLRVGSGSGSSCTVHPLETSISKAHLERKTPIRHSFLTNSSCREKWEHEAKQPAPLFRRGVLPRADWRPAGVDSALSLRTRAGRIAISEEADRKSGDKKSPRITRISADKEKNGTYPRSSFDFLARQSANERQLICGSEWCRFLSLRDPAALRDGWATPGKRMHQELSGPSIVKGAFRAK
jgi:hypothetical protein